VTIVGTGNPEERRWADADDVRRLALGLPHVEEVDSDGFDFRVGGKGVVWSYPERTPGRPRVIRTDVAVLYVGDEAEKQALLLGEPRLFFTAPGYDGWPLVLPPAACWPCTPTGSSSSPVRISPPACPGSLARWPPDPPDHRTTCATACSPAWLPARTTTTP
jgi:hypothetical protein